MKQEIRALAIKYIDEVMDDQRRLGYTGDARPEAHEKAVADAETALRDLAASANDSKKAVAA
jgi:hypothetical protein